MTPTFETMCYQIFSTLLAVVYLIAVLGLILKLALAIYELRSDNVRSNSTESRSHKDRD